MMATVARTDGYAIASLVCSVVAFFGFFFVGSILGIVFGRMARARIAAQPGLGGEGLAHAGVLIGWIGLGVALFFAVVLLRFVALPFGFY